MLERKIKEDVHKGCPYRGTCKKDETKCCYLVKGQCYIENTDLRRLI